MERRQVQRFLAVNDPLPGKGIAHRLLQLAEPAPVGRQEQQRVAQQAGLLAAFDQNLL
jgi:hypothetical protein